MNRTETAKALGKAIAYDNREPSRMMIEAWHEALGDFDLADVLDAIGRHYASSPEFIQPAHVRAQIGQMRRARSLQDRRDRAGAAQSAIRQCALCDERGYRLPGRGVVCTHREVRAVGASSRLRRVLEAGS